MTESIDRKDEYQLAEEMGNQAYGSAVAGQFNKAIDWLGTLQKTVLRGKNDERLNEIRDRYLRGIIEELINHATVDGEVVREKLVGLISKEDVDASNHITDPETGLRLPPLTRTPYTGRGNSESGKRMTLEEFVKSEWGEYTNHHLLYSEHIRQVDNSLYTAIYYRAKQNKLSVADYALSLGILTRHHLLQKPPPGKERQVALLKRTRLLTSAWRHSELADEIE